MRWLCLGLCLLLLGNGWLSSGVKRLLWRGHYLLSVDGAHDTRWCALCWWLFFCLMCVRQGMGCMVKLIELSLLLLLLWLLWLLLLLLLLLLLWLLLLLLLLWGWGVRGSVASRGVGCLWEIWRLLITRHKAAWRHMRVLLLLLLLLLYVELLLVVQLLHLLQ